MNDGLMGFPLARADVVDAVRLDYTKSTDTSQAVSAATWTDFDSSQTFSVMHPGSLVTITLGGNVLGVGNAAAEQLAARIIVDSSGVPDPAVTKQIAGGMQPAGTYGNVLAGSRPVVFSGLSVGSHTLKLQVFAKLTGTFLCRPATQTTETLFIHVRETKV